MTITIDKNLITISEITKRMLSIKRQIDKLENTETRSNHIDAFKKKNEKIAKLNACHDALHVKRAKLMKETYTYN